MLSCAIPAANHTLLCAYHKLQQGNILLCANISLPQAMPSYKLIMYCSKVIFYHVLYVPVASSTLLYANHVLQQSTLSTLL